MPASYTVALTDVPKQIVKMPFGVAPSMCYVTNESGSQDIFIGDKTVAPDAGFLVTKQLGSGVSYRMEFELYAGQELYAVCRVGQTGTVHVGYSA